ncbi:hypothetical protein [Acutalibacter muris]|uniref:hypothetical protein n=1 Tax=Acutalibacter muris TaxID=1796620 RepID=UPI001C3EFF23|nr:hypothetical protein [Acutalibacter muris]MCI9191980.1 hypothetical protein [Acutalibacter muris]MCI9544289.1 hypothetical protein [Acutalibacter muris]
MTPVSGLSNEAIRPLAAPEKAQGAPKVQRAEEDAQSRRPKAMMDEYVPEERSEPSGRYWRGKGEKGQPKIYFDDPERPAGAPNKPEEKWVCDTGKVDREIEKLKKKQQELKQQLGTENNEARIKELERQLAQTEQELGEKDNDTYRKQNASFTQLS